MNNNSLRLDANDIRPYINSTGVLLMILRGANVWTNFSYGGSISTPTSWLLNPEGRRIILFIKNKKSWGNCIQVLIHTCNTNHLGEPNKIKSISQLPLDKESDKSDALKTVKLIRHQLQQQ